MVQGETRVVKFKIHNRNTMRSVHLLGASGSCGPMGCVTVNNLPRTIPAGGSTTLEVEYKGGRKGHCEQEVPIFSDCPGQTEIKLTVVAEVEAR